MIDILDGQIEKIRDELQDLEKMHYELGELVAGLREGRKIEHNGVVMGDVNAPLELKCVLAGEYTLSGSPRKSVKSWGAWKPMYDS